jgi:16S rRNA (cytosine1402-N4)-methyltransferase
MPSVHIPVMVEEVVSFIRPSDGVYCDMTVGGGGHSHALMSAAGPDARLIAIDWDDAALPRAQERLAEFSPRVTFVRDDYRNVAAILDSLGVEHLDGCLIDTGLSSDQLADRSRGFSFDGTNLDMRMDARRDTTAQQLVAELPVDGLAAVIRQLGEEGQAKRIAAEIARYREREAISDTATLAALVRKAITPRRSASKRRIRPETKTLMALRLAVNDELGSLSCGIRSAATALKSPGRLCILAYMSLEDRIAKRALRELAGTRLASLPSLPIIEPTPPKEVQILTPRPLRPSAAEVRRNRSARSARLRVAERC